MSGMWMEFGVNGVGCLGGAEVARIKEGLRVDLLVFEVEKSEQRGVVSQDAVRDRIWCAGERMCNAG